MILLKTIFLINFCFGLSFGHPSTESQLSTTPLPKLNTTILNTNSSLTSLNTVLSEPNSTADASPGKLNSTTPVKVNLILKLTDPTNFKTLIGNESNSTVPMKLNLTIKLAENSTTFKTLSSSELVSRNIEKPKDLAKNLLLKNSTAVSTSANRSTNESDEKKLNKAQLDDELDNNSTALLNNGSYSSIGDDILNINEFSGINLANLASQDLILDSLNDTKTDEISLNSTTRSLF